MTETENSAKTESSAEPESTNAKNPGESSGDKWWWAIAIGILLWIGFVSVAVLVMLSRGH